jgi:hypothetical protein
MMPGLLNGSGSRLRLDFGEMHGALNRESLEELVQFLAGPHRRLGIHPVRPAIADFRVILLEECMAFETVF